MRCAIISDIHANLSALEAVLADIGDRVEKTWCLGDIVGYGPDPNECVQRVVQENIICVVGNHDWACLGKLDLDEFNPDARLACRWTMEQLTLSSQEYLDRLPVSLVMGDFTLVHGSPRAPIWEYVTNTDSALENLSFFDTSVCLVGHTHVPLAFYGPGRDPVSCERRWLGGPAVMHLDVGRWILNPGGLGQPRDGDPRASYLILDTETMLVEVCRVPYPVEAVQQRMEDADLPNSLITRLALGW